VQLLARLAPPLTLLANPSTGGSEGGFGGSLRRVEASGRHGSEGLGPFRARRSLPQVPGSLGGASMARYAVPAVEESAEGGGFAEAGGIGRVTLSRNAGPPPNEIQSQCKMGASVRGGLAALARRFALGLLTAGLLGTVVAAAAEKGPVKSLFEMRRENVIVQKYDLSCGAAALATILDFQFGLHLTEKEVAEGLIERKEYIEHPELLRVREGFSLLDMKRYVEKLGFQGIGYGELDLKDIERMAPIIVAVRPIGYNHFVIFRGRIGDQVLLADPSFGNLTMQLAHFERIWINFPKFGKVGFIVTRTGKPAPPGLLALRPDQFIAPRGTIVRQILFR
jgi:uncharacterized protein